MRKAAKDDFVFFIFFVFVFVFVFVVFVQCHDRIKVLRQASGCSSSRHDDDTAERYFLV